MLCGGPEWTASGTLSYYLPVDLFNTAGYYFPTLGLKSSITAFYGNPRQYWLDVQYRW